MQLLDCPFVFIRGINLVGWVGRSRLGCDLTLNTHNRAVGKGVPAHDTLLGSLTKREFHPKVRKAEQVGWPERDGCVVARIGERSSNHIEPIGDTPHRPARVVVEPVVERADRLDVRDDRGSEKVCVAQDDILAKLARFIDCTRVY